VVIIVELNQAITKVLGGVKDYSLKGVFLIVLGIKSFIGQRTVSVGVLQTTSVRHLDYGCLVQTC
jgi:hypothetical protein